jgi:hypothetical protein
MQHILEINSHYFQWAFTSVLPPDSTQLPLCNQHVALAVLSNLCFECPKSFMPVLPRVFTCGVIVLDDRSPFVRECGRRLIVNLLQWISLSNRPGDAQIRKHIRLLSSPENLTKPLWECEKPSSQCFYVASGLTLSHFVREMVEVLSADVGEDFALNTSREALKFTRQLPIRLIFLITYAISNFQFSYPTLSVHLI